MHEPAALAPVVVDLEVVQALAAHLHHLALPQHRLLAGRAARFRAQRDLIRDDHGGRGLRGAGRADGATKDERQACECGAQHGYFSSRTAGSSALTPEPAPRLLPPSSAVPMKPPSAGVGAMMTWTLSESLSASVF